MIITKQELKTAIYAYQIDEISELDDDIILMNIAAAEAEVKSYLSNAYDVQAIFSVTGNDRNPLIVEVVKNITIWYLIRLSNVDIIYEQVKERYDRAIAFLRDTAKGIISPDLPHATNVQGETVSHLRYGSNKKFNHF